MMGGEDIFKKRMSGRPFSKPELERPGKGTELGRNTRRKEAERGRGL